MAISIWLDGCLVLIADDGGVTAVETYLADMFGGVMEFPSDVSAPDIRT